jgi:protein-S-isoprenylcysteine O-methyltransferase Ste14
LFRKKARFQVALLLGIILLVFSHTKDDVMRMGIPFVFLGELLRIWANGHIKKSQELTTSGPYAYVRNPLYLGTSIIVLGFCIISRNIILSFIALICFSLLYRNKILSEEKDLKHKFGEEYERYCQYVPRIIPNFRRYKFANKNKFKGERLRESKEIKTTLWIVVFIIAFYLHEELILDKGKIDLKILLYILLGAGLIALEFIYELFYKKLSNK